MYAQEFLESGQYLPEFMRDFHDQKLLFKYLNEVVCNAREKAESTNKMQLEKLPDWVSAQIYTIDFFLWVMARHGYTLQRSRKKISDFEDMEQDLSDYRRYLDKKHMEELRGYNKAMHKSEPAASNFQQSTHVQ
jgi:hypothetical protein